jgi:YgiT-type zinc finger domain-containing protein
MDLRDSICPVCHVGKLRDKQITYTQVYEGQLVVIPNFKALVCDICGEKVFDNVVLRRLNGLLGGDQQNLQNTRPGQPLP